MDWCRPPSGTRAEKTATKTVNEQPSATKGQGADRLYALAIAGSDTADAGAHTALLPHHEERPSGDGASGAATGTCPYTGRNEHDANPARRGTRWADLLGQRIFGIACGHPNDNKPTIWPTTPIHELLLRRDPVAEDPLASQPTISRFKNCATRSALYRMGRELATRDIESHARRLDGRGRRIIIDLDPTDDRTDGAQQLSFFNFPLCDAVTTLPLVALWLSALVFVVLRLRRNRMEGQKAVP